MTKHLDHPDDPAPRHEVEPDRVTTEGGPAKPGVGGDGDPTTPNTPAPEEPVISEG